MSNPASTRLWLSTIYVEWPTGDTLQGVRTQRLVVADLKDDAVVVRRQVRQIISDWYGSRAELEKLEPVPSIAMLPRMFNGLDLIKRSQFTGLDRHHTPASVVLEMGYDDYSPSMQETPSRIESLCYPNRDLAEAAAQHAIDYVNKAYPNYHSYWTFRTDYAELNTDHAEAVESVEGIIDEMMENYVGEDVFR